MRVTEENEAEMYIELEDEDLPYEMPVNGKKVYVRFKEKFPGAAYAWGRQWKSREELLLECPA